MVSKDLAVASQRDVFLISLDYFRARQSLSVCKGVMLTVRAWIYLKKGESRKRKRKQRMNTILVSNRYVYLKHKL